MFLVNALQVLCGRTVIEVFSHPRSLKFVYVSRGSRDLARQTLLFLCCFFLSFFCSFNFPLNSYCDKEQKKKACEGGKFLHVISTSFQPPLVSNRYANTQIMYWHSSPSELCHMTDIGTVFPLISEVKMLNTDTTVPNNTPDAIYDTNISWGACPQMAMYVSTRIIASPPIFLKC